MDAAIDLTGDDDEPSRTAAGASTTTASSTIQDSASAADRVAKRVRDETPRAPHVEPVSYTHLRAHETLMNL
eukprot:7259309-Prymnesium_polylepis.1